jgi:hypothetical protein
MNGNGASERDDGTPDQAGPAAPGRGARQGALLGGMTLGVAAILVVATVFVGSGGPGPTPSPAAGRASPHASATAAASPPGPASSLGGTPTPAPQDWAAAVLPPIEQVAELVATRVEPGGTSIRTAFALTSRSGTAAAELVKGLEVTPPVELKVAAGATAATALLEPKAPLATGTTYRATLRLPDGSLAGSWVFQTSTPPQVAGTLPSDRTTSVPLDTGIEITFDQDGVGDVAPFFSISPKVAGRFERHGRTAVFVPDALKPLTVYTVKIRRGVPREGSALVLEEDLVFRFQTATSAGPTATPKPEAWIQAERELAEVGTADPPIVELTTDEGISRVSVRVYRLPTVEDAIDAYVALLKAPDWAAGTDAGLVRTAGLVEVVRFSAPIQRWPTGAYGRASGEWIRFPEPLAAGWYLVDIPRRGRNVQVVLQVTDVQTTTIAGSGRTVVWANDLVTGGPLADATVSTPDGELVGRTDTDGLMQAQTPARLLDADLEASPRAGVLVVRAADGAVGGESVPGRASFVPVDGWRTQVPFADTFWRVLYTDRSLFRQTDTIEAWGLLRPRDGGATPDAELRLTAGDWWSEDTGAPPAAIVRAAVVPDPRTGVFAASIPLAGLPLGDYVLGLWIGEQRIAGTSVRVGVIRKPAYQLDVATDRRVVVDGDTLTATVTATFFDGTRAPGIEVTTKLESEGNPSSTTATTGADGTTEVALPVRWTSDWWQWGWPAVSAQPTNPEEADIKASTQVLAFSSRVVLDGEATLEGKRLGISGSLHAVDLERLEREQPNEYEGGLRPQGAAIAGSTVIAAIVERWQARIRIGQGYDFISKKTFDTYRYEDRAKSLGMRRATTDASGGFSFNVAVPAADHWYEITLSSADADGRRASLVLEARREESGASGSEPSWPSLRLATRAGREDWDAGYAVGDPIMATVHAASGAVMPAEGTNRYLFYTARPGLLEARVQGSPQFTGTFTAPDVPSLTIGAAWFDGSAGGLTTGMYWGCGGSLPVVEARIDPASRPVAVQVSSDATRYRPGASVTLAVRTTDAAGRPVRSSVVLRAIDEKLYAIGGAGEIDAAGDLYWWMASENGIASSAVSHNLPVYVPASGATCGGGDGRDEVSSRDDFRDTLLFRRVTTGADGRATVTFDLSDDLTSWRISAAAISSSLDVGQATLLVPVGLPLFVEAPLAPDYLAGERPILRVRAFGDALKAGERVSFTVSAPSLGMGETRVVGEAFTAVEIPLPALRVGDHEVLVSAAAGSGATAAVDRLTRTIHVIDTRFAQRRTIYADLLNGLPRTGGEGFVTVVFADAGRARLIAPLESLAAGYGARVDQGLAAAIAKDLLVTTFGADPARFPSPAFEPSRYHVQPADSEGNDGLGVALLPYASADLALSARVALIAGDRFDVDELRAYFTGQRAEEAQGLPRVVPRETRNVALAGLAGLGEPVLDEIRAALADPTLTIRERLYLALGAANLGDHATALAVERDLLGRYGERLGPWLRLRVGSSLDDTIEATALVALIGATVGDPAAEWAEAYVEENRAVDDLFNLQQVGYITRVLERTPAEAARVTYSVAGVERTVDVDAGGAFSLSLTPAQVATFTARPAAGRVGVAVSWDAPVDPATLAQDPSLTLTRTVSPAGPVPSGRLVEVTLRATFGPQAVDGCYSVVDVLPSGLAPVGEESQRVAFCLSPGSDRTDSVTYRARVVTAGTYTWEPAILQSARASESLALTPTTQLEIR